MEIAVTILILGLLLAISVPTIQTLSGSYTLKGNGEAIAGQLRLAREKAIATGVNQVFHCNAGYLNSDYHVHSNSPSGWVTSKWSLSKGVTYYWGAGTNAAYTMQKDGRSDASGMIILQDPRGNRDTISVQYSGLVLTQ